MITVVKFREDSLKMYFVFLFNILFKVWTEEIFSCKVSQLWNESENIYNIYYFYIACYTKHYVRQV